MISFFCGYGYGFRRRRAWVRFSLSYESILSRSGLPIASMSGSLLQL
jgi:hypothetical protein